MPQPKVMTVRDLREYMEILDDDDKLFFGDGRLSFYRFKYRGDKLVNLEFNEVYEITIDPADND